MTEAAKNVKGTESIAAKLQEQLIQVWLKSRKTPDDALLEIGLGKTVDTLLESPLLDTWVKYMTAFNAKYPQKKTTMIETLTRRFGDEKVVKMLSAAKSKEATQNIATKLESAQLKMWLSGEKSVEDVYKLLKLDYPNVPFYENPLLSTWVAYMDAFVKENPDKISTMLSKLGSELSERKLNQVLLVAQKYPSMDSAVTKIQTQKIQRYLASNQSPKEVFKLLGLDHAGDTVLSDPLFKSWMNYVKDFNKKNPKHQESWAEPLRTHYQWFGTQKLVEKAMQSPSSVKTAKLAEKKLLKMALDHEEPPTNVFKFMYLDEAGEQTLANPRFKEWVKYLNDFNRRYPDQKVSMIDGLRKSYDDKALLKIFNAAQKNPTTEKLADNLQGALTNKWLALKKQPEDLRVFLSDAPLADDMIARYTKKSEALSTHAS